MKPLPIVFAFAVAALIAWRWRHLAWPVRLADAALCAALALYGAGVFHLPELETVIGDLGSALGPYTYALVGVMAFLETGAFVGLLVPGETVVIVGGVVAGQGHIDLLALLGVTWVCAFAGDLTGYALGRRLGRRFLLEHGPRVHITEPRVIRVKAFFARYGLATILIGRFVGLVRPIAPFLAGASRSQRAGSPHSRSSAPACGAPRSCSWASCSGNRSMRPSRSPSAARWRWGACSSSSSP